MWDEPDYAAFLERLASFSRLIIFDKRGTGLSDPVPLDQLPTLEQRMDDVRAVMDAVGSGRAALLGHSEGGNMCVAAVDAVRGLGMEIRAGVHTGEVEVSNGDLRGIAVHIGSRVSGLAGPGEVPGLAHGRRPRGRLRHRAGRTRRARAEGGSRHLARVRRGVGLTRSRPRRRVGYASRVPNVGEARP